MKVRHVVPAAVLAVFLAGCGKRPPQFNSQVSGVVLLDGKPLPKAKVEFQPALDGFGAEMNSSAVTDDEGRFTVVRVSTQEPGASVCKHRVIISEMPTPGEFRSQDPAVQAKLVQYKASLKNRPIPTGYSSPITAIEVEVTPDQHDYKIELKR
jgi:hypothetical protein